MSTSPDIDAVPVSSAISVPDVLRGVLHRKLMILCFTLCAGLLGLAAAHLLAPIYSAEAQLLVDNLETRFDRMQNLENQVVPGVDDRIVASQMAVLKSEDMGRRVIAALALQDNPEFNARLKGIGALKKIKIALGFGQDPRRMTPEQLALASYLDGLSVYQQPNSNVIAVKYSAGEAETAASIANTLAETYIVATRESQLQPTERAREWLSKQIEALRLKLAASERSAEEFRAQAGLFKGATATLDTQEISELNTQITVAQSASAEARARADTIRQLLADKGSVDTSSEVLASPVIQKLKEQRTVAAQSVAELSATYLPNHPKMIAAQSQLANVDRQFRGEALKIVAALEEQARSAKARESALRASLEGLKDRASGANLDDVKLKALERDAAADRALLEAMLSRYAEASARQDQASQPGLARIIQSATVPASPSFPKRGPLVLLLTLTGLALGFALAFLLEIMAAAARLTERMQVARLQPVAMAPEAKFSWQSPSEPAIVQPAAAFAQAPAQDDPGLLMDSAEMMAAAKSMSAWAMAAQRDVNAVCFAVTSIDGGPGDTSMAAVALARGMGGLGRRVVIIDLSRGGSWLEQLCGVATGPGIADLVSGEAAFTKVIGRDTKSAVHLLRFGLDHSANATALLDERTGSVMAALGDSYDVVIVHAGEAVSETPVLLRKCDAALVLAPPARLAEAGDAVQALASAGLHAVCHVLIGRSGNAVAPQFSFAGAAA
ncbi:MAG: GumC family protein [Aestuariivirga sp.]